MEIFDIFGAAFPPPVAIKVKFCTAKRAQVPVGSAKFDLNRCNESPLRGEKPDFWPVSKFNTGSLLLRGNPAGNKKVSYRKQITRQHLCQRKKIGQAWGVVEPVKIFLSSSLVTL